LEACELHLLSLDVCLLGLKLFFLHQYFLGLALGSLLFLSLSFSRFEVELHLRELLRIRCHILPLSTHWRTAHSCEPCKSGGELK